MNEPPKPGWLLAANSVAVIGLCSLPMSAGLAVMASWYRAGAPGGGEMFLAIVVGGLFCGPSMILGVCQYRGTFHGDGNAARDAATLAVLATLTLWVFNLGGLVPSVDALLGGRFGQAWLFGLMIGLTGFAAFTAWINSRWSRILAAVDGLPRRPQFSIRDLLAITLWIGVVAGITRWIVVSGR